MFHSQRSPQHTCTRSRLWCFGKLHFCHKKVVMRNIQYLKDRTIQGIGGSRGGAPGARPPPTGPNSFILTCKIFETQPPRGSMAPPYEVHAPPTGNPGSATAGVTFLGKLGLSFHIEIRVFFRIPWFSKSMKSRVFQKSVKSVLFLNLQFSKSAVFQNPQNLGFLLKSKDFADFATMRFRSSIK